MSYVNSNLIGGEQVLYHGKVTLLAWIPWFFWGFIFGVLTRELWYVGFLLIPLGFLVLRSNEAGITNKRLIAKTGLIKRDTVEIPIKKVSSLQIKQSIFGRLLGYGSLVISDTGSARAPIRYIKDPLRFRQKFFEVQDAAES